MATQRDKQLLPKMKALHIFWTHLTVFVVANGCLWFTWLMNESISIYAWQFYVTAGWGIILLFHYAVADRIYRKGKLTKT
jgi:hypothetical protein